MGAGAVVGLAVVMLTACSWSTKPPDSRINVVKVSNPTAIAFDGSGDLVVGDRSGGVTEWSKSSWKMKRTTTIGRAAIFRGAAVTALTCSGNDIVVGDSTGRVTVLGSDRKIVRQLKRWILSPRDWLLDGIVGVRTSPSGKQVLAAYRSGYLIAWDLESGRQLGSFEQGFVAHILSLDLDESGTYAAVGIDRDRVNVWRIRDWKDKHGYQLEAELGWGLLPLAKAVRFVPGREALLVRMSDGMVRMAIAEGAPWHDVSNLPRFSVKGSCVSEDCFAISRDGHFAAASDSSSNVVVYSLRHGFRYDVPITIPEAIGGIAFSPDNAHLALRGANAVYILPMEAVFGKAFGT